MSSPLWTFGARVLNRSLAHKRALQRRITSSSFLLNVPTADYHKLSVSPSSSKQFQPLSHPLRLFSDKPDQHWDDIKNLPRFHPDKGELVYAGPLAFMVKAVKAFSVSTSLLALGLQPYLLMHTKGHSTGVVLALGSFMGFFILVTPLLIHFITKKYVTDLYYNSNTGIFTVTSYNFFVRRKTVEFSPEDVKVPELPSMFTTLTVKGRPLFMDRDLFLSKQAYIKMMGYDKPIEWELDEKDK